MSGWEKGDLALCIKLGAWKGDVTGVDYGTYGRPRGGGIYTVTAVDRLLGSLYLAEFPNAPRPFASHRFRKIPPYKADAEDLETIKLLNTPKITEPAMGEGL